LHERQVNGIQDHFLHVNHLRIRIAPMVASYKEWSALHYRFRYQLSRLFYHLGDDRLSIQKLIEHVEDLWGSFGRAHNTVHAMLAEYEDQIL